MRSGKYLVTEDAVLLSKLESLDAVVEATGLTEVGATVAWNCIQHGKHVIMLNVETDVTVGPLNKISPPDFPAAGPISIIQSAFLIVSSSCSTSTTVFPLLRSILSISSKRRLSLI